MTKQITPHQKQALNYKDHISLTANAGSGKTFVLSQRYVDIAVNEDVDLRDIVAITFTEKAAGELYNKISSEINERILDCENNKQKNKLERIRRQLVSANISTLHSFCIDLLRQFPLEAQLDANFSGIDAQLSDELIQLSVEETIQSLISDDSNSSELKNLIRIFGSKTLLMRNIITIMGDRKNILNLEQHLYSKSEEEISKFFYDSFETGAKKIIIPDLQRIMQAVQIVNEAVLNEKPDNAIAKETTHLINLISKEKDFPKLLKTLQFLKDLIITKNSCNLKKQGYLKNGREVFEQEIRDIEKYFADTCCFSVPENHTQIELTLGAFGKKIFNLYNKCFNLYTEKKRQNRYLDFEDILILTKEILQQQNVLYAVEGKYKYIMVDEYQDTNEIQYEIFMPLLDYLRNGNLFVVGDEKQSIYMFRDAELEVFDKTKMNISNVSGERGILNLPDSFRMSPAICLFTNSIFSRIFANPEPMFNEVSYSELVCARNDSFKGHIEFLLKEKNDEITEADLAARRILQLINESSDEITFNDIAILCRKRKSFDEIEEAFNKYNIPYNILGGKGFYQRQVIYDIYNYLSFLFNQNNSPALVGILRSPFFFVSDAEIYEISLQKKNTFWENLFAYSYSKKQIN